jgi:hypothetical protein
MTDSKDLIKQWKERLDELFLDAKIPNWKQKKPLALLEKMQDFAAVGQKQTWLLIQQALEEWVHKNRVQPKIFPQSSLEFNDPESFFKNKIKELEKRLVESSSWIPSEEFDAFQSRIRTLANDDWESLRDLRLKFVDRIRTSWSSMQDAQDAKPFFQADASSSVGPYNNSQNFLELMDLIASNDPIWIGDFVNLYGDLNHLYSLYEDKLAKK